MILKKLSSNSFVKNTIILLKGSVFAKLLPLLIMPLLTRLYSVEAFGVLSLFTGIAAIATVLATARYEKAMLLPKSSSESLAIVALTFFLGFIVSIVFEFIIVILMSQDMGYEEFGKLVYLLPVFIFLIGAYRSIFEFMNRVKLYKLMGVSIIILAVTQALSKLLFGLMGVGTGLIIATVLANIVCVLYLIWKIRLFALLKRMSRQKIFLVMKKYQDQPRYQLLADTIYAASLQTPILLTTYLFGLEAAGFLSLAITITLYPSTFIGNSISSVYRQQSMAQLKKTGKFSGIYQSLVLVVLGAAVIPLILLTLYLPDLVSLVFGENWEKSADIAKIMAFMVVFQFIDRITSCAYIMMNKQREFMYTQFFMFVVLVLSFIIGFYLSHDIITTIIIYSVTCGAIFIFQIGRGYHFSKGLAS